MAHVFTARDVLQILQAVVAFVAIQVMHLPGVFRHGKSMERHFDHAMNSPLLPTNSEDHVPVCLARAVGNDSFGVAKPAKRAHLPTLFEMLKRHTTLQCCSAPSQRRRKQHALHRKAKQARSRRWLSGVELSLSSSLFYICKT